MGRARMRLGRFPASAQAAVSAFLQASVPASSAASTRRSVRPTGKRIAAPNAIEGMPEEGWNDTAPARDAAPGRYRQAARA